MPQSDSRKLVYMRGYMREYMREYRKKNPPIKSVKSLRYENGGENGGEMLSPSRPRWGTETWRGRRHMVEYMAYLAARGMMVAWTTRGGYERVNLETGEIGYSAPPSHHGIVA